MGSNTGQLLSSILALFMICMTVPAQAKVSVEEAERLKGELTPLGAERAGNAEGTIPAWDGGMTETPANVTFTPNSGELRPDPFADEKPLYTITAQNYEQYQDKLSAGNIEHFKRYPDTFKMHVYPTHRTTAAPQWVYDNTYKNALEGEILGDGADGFIGAWGGYPFPIPKHGLEPVFNHTYRWQGDGVEQKADAYLVYPNGDSVLSSGYKTWYLNNYYTGPREDFKSTDPAVGLITAYERPARRKGELLLSQDFTDQRGVTNRAAWQYLPGNRRVRRAPNVGYDTPGISFGGYGTFDDSYMFNGPPDRWDAKIVGKQEKLVLFNGYKLELAPVKDLITAKHLNPEHLRWELHRVWVVEMTLKEGKRHVYGKQVFYIDEDSWMITLKDMYDTRGNLWRTAAANIIHLWENPSALLNSYYVTDLEANVYSILQLVNGIPNHTITGEKAVKPLKFFTPQTLRKMGLR